MDPPQSVRGADSRSLQVMEIAYAVLIALDMTFEPLTLDSSALAAMPGTDDVRMLGFPTLKILGLGIYAGLTKYARRKVERRAQPMESVHLLRVDA